MNDMNTLDTKQIQQLLLDMLIKVDEVFDRHGIRYSLDGGTLLGAVRHKGFIPWDDDIDIIVPRPDFDLLCSHPEWAPDGLRFELPGENGYCMPFIKLCDPKWRAQEQALAGIYEEYLWIDIFPADPIPVDSKEAACLLEAQRKSFKKASLAYHDVDTLVGLSSSRLKAVAKRAILPAYRVLISPQRTFNELTNRAKLTPFSTARIAGNVVWGLSNPDKPGFPVEDFDNLIDLEFVGHTFKACPHWDDYLKGLYGNYMQLPPEDQRVTHGMKVWRADEKEEVR